MLNKSISSFIIISVNVKIVMVMTNTFRELPQMCERLIKKYTSGIVPPYEIQWQKMPSDVGRGGNHTENDIYY